MAATAGSDDDEDRPELFGHPFDGPMDAANPAHAGATIPVPVHFDLHVWLNRENPDGMQAPFNPDVTCPTLNWSGFRE